MLYIYETYKHRIVNTNNHKNKMFSQVNGSGWADYEPRFEDGGYKTTM